MSVKTLMAVAMSVDKWNSKLLSKKLPGMKGSKTVKVRSGCNSLNCVVEHRWGASEDGKLVEESLGSDVRDEVEGEQQGVM